MSFQSLNFINNLRASTNTGAKFPLSNGLSIIKKRGDLERLSEDLKAGKIKGSKEYMDNEFRTVRDMDSLYLQFSTDFQNDFYNKHYDQSAEGEMSDREIENESAKWLENKVKESGLDKEKMANGKTFVENFRLYGYDRNLLPDLDSRDRWYLGDSDRPVTGLRANKIFSNLIPTDDFSTQYGLRERALHPPRLS